MPALDQMQKAMMQALDHGPDFLADGLFAGSRERVLAGMKVHANTISHARLVALEDTFPRVRGLLGDAQFNALSRLYVAQPEAAARMLVQLGDGFPAYLAYCGEPRFSIDLARFELRWLASYHAAEAPWLRLADLAGIEPQVLMEVAVKQHPAACLERFDPKVNRLIGAQVPGLAQAAAILLTRPEAMVLITPASAAMDALFAAAKNPITIGNLLASPYEPAAMDQPCPDDCMQALIALLNAGALTPATEQQVA